jgi:Ca2+-transporting ATPase
MSTVHRGPDGVVLLAKGAPESILERTDEALSPEGVAVPLANEERQALISTVDAMAERGTRTLALARRRLGEVPTHPEDEEEHLVFVALIGLQDPVRPEARAAVAEAHSAGIRIVMVTGDHPGTAATIAADVGLMAPGEEVVTGAMLRVSGPDLDRDGSSVYARIDPGQKLALVESFRDRGDVVAVTGDGVNDAPALRQAHIGVAMGRSGSDVAREAADMVITDDNLSTIVTAVREGRGIYDNIRKVVDYLIAGNLSEITVVVVSLLLFPGLGVPLLPLQLLWINLLTDGPPALALGVDPVDPSLMARPPRDPIARLLGARRLTVLFVRGALIASAALGSLAVARYAWDEPWSHARAIMFSVLMTAHLVYAFVARRPTRGIFSNPWLLLGVASGIALQLVIVLWPTARSLFGTAPLMPREWVLIAVAAALPIIMMMTVPLETESARRSRSPVGADGTGAIGERRLPPVRP